MKPVYTPLGVKLLYVPAWPHPPQESFLWLDCLDAFYGGSAGPGKSWSLLAAALQYVDIPGYSAILLRRTFRDLNLPGALIPRSKEWLMPVLGDRAWNGTENRWTFPSGATLSFGYLQHADDHLRYQGAEFAFVGVDEASQVREHQLRYMFSRLRRPHEGQIGQVPLRYRLASNPGDVSHEYLKHRYIEKVLDPEDPEDTPARSQARAFIKARLQDNPSLDYGEYVASLANLDPETRKQLLDGDWDARPLGDWYFTEQQMAAVARLGREYRDRMNAGTMPEPVGGVVHVGVDWGDATGAVLVYPLEAGGVYVAKEYLEVGSEPIAATPKILGLNQTAWPFGHARHDASAPQSIRTFHRTAQRIAGKYAPAGPTSVPFGKYKAITSLHLRRLARRAHGIYLDDKGNELPGPDDGATFMPGPLPGHLAISPDCPTLLRIMRGLQRDPKDEAGNWLKEPEQEAVDALVAAMAPAAKRYRDSLKARPQAPRRHTVPV
jgi:hypothetical protein